MQSSDECWDIFLDIINFGIENFIPKVVQRKKKGLKCHPELRKLINKKSQLWRSKKSAPCKTVNNRYNSAAKSVRSFILDQTITDEHDIISSKDNNKFFKYINKSLSHTNGIAPIMQSTGVFATTSMDKANCLNAHFASVETLDNGILPPLPMETIVKDDFLELVYFDDTDIYFQCNKLKNTT